MLHLLLAEHVSGQCFDLVDHNLFNDELVKLGVHPAIYRWELFNQPGAMCKNPIHLLFVGKNEWWPTSRDQTGSVTVFNFGEQSVEELAWSH